MINVIKKEIDMEESLKKRLDTFEDLKDTYIFSKEHDSKDKDDFDLEI